MTHTELEWDFTPEPVKYTKPNRLVSIDAERRLNTGAQTLLAAQQQLERKKYGYGF